MADKEEEDIRTYKQVDQLYIDVVCCVQRGQVGLIIADGLCLGQGAWNAQRVSEAFWRVPRRTHPLLLPSPRE
jgi:hypothetical protein